MKYLELRPYQEDDYNWTAHLEQMETTYLPKYLMEIQQNLSFSNLKLAHFKQEIDRVLYDEQ